MDKKFKKYNNATSDLHYYLLFCPRYQRKIFNIPGVESEFLRQLDRICREHDFEIVSVTCGEDHVLLHLVAGPYIEPASIVRLITQGTTKPLISKFEKLNRVVSVWTRSFLASTTPIGEAEIKEYKNALKAKS